MFITHCPIVTLQLHNFDLFRTCRTSSFCTVVWQLARFQLTRRIAWSLCDSWVSCCIVQDEKLSSSKITLCRRSLLKKADVKNRLSSMPDVRVIDRNRFPRTLSGDGLGQSHGAASSVVELFNCIVFNHDTQYSEYNRAVTRIRRRHRVIVWVTSDDRGANGKLSLTTPASPRYRSERLLRQAARDQRCVSLSARRM